ncbi:MAG: UDP-glucose/GDP-mannose dehydrogenase family protein [Actinomycetota bacterium]|nr:UDP-glucose/GDP-mannose dehydrogenase family protein [Actinomycetota bacterium]
MSDFARRVVVVGTGYVGLTTGACLASLGHRVVCADVDQAKVERLRTGQLDIREPGLGPLVAEMSAAGRLSFVVGAAAGLDQLRADGTPVEILIVCVPTPMGIGGVADLTVVESVIEEIRRGMPAGSIVVAKSTVPVGTSERIAELMARPDVAVVSNPEFLREGFGVHDFLHPDRIIIGSATQDAAERVAALYARVGAPTVLTDCASAEMIKYAANCFLAIKLSYVNALAELCERLDADVTNVTEGLGYDRRIGSSYLSPGPGWGGSCLPKDTAALLQLSDTVDFEFRLLRAAMETNTRQSARIVEKVSLAVTGKRTGTLARRRIALLGLAFKAGTNDVRDSPALAVAARLRQAGAELCGYDPAVAAGNPVNHGMPTDGSLLTLVDDPYVAAKDADAVVILTEWPEFRALDWLRLRGVVRQPVVVDTRNLLDPDVPCRAGFSWVGVGRAPRRPAA